MNLSTISVKDIIPVATYAAQFYTRKPANDTLLRNYGSHVSLEDLIMDAVEKVLRMNPVYLTKAYVFLAVRCTLIDAGLKKKLDVVETEDDPLEDTIEANEDSILELEALIEDFLTEDEKEVYEAVANAELYAAIAENLGISVRTLERRVHELKKKVKYILEDQPIPRKYILGNR